MPAEEPSWTTQNRASFMEGFRDILPVMVATMPFGLVFGALAVKQGFSLFESLLMSGSVYGGSSQFVVLQMWTDPLPFWTILMSALAVNLRHVLYSASLGRKMTHWPTPTRYAAFAFLTDPTFALSALQSGPRLGVAYYFGLSLPLYASWLIATAAGAVLGNFIRRPEAIGLDFIVTAYFLVLVLGFRKNPNAVPVIAASAAAALAAHFAFGPPWHFAAGAVAGMATAALLAKPKAAAA